jgi:hypothetical protein
MRRIFMLTAALAIPASVVLVALDGGQALAKGGPKGKTTCSSMNGSVTGGTVTISGCADSNGANTGGGTGALSISLLATGGNVTWNSGKVTTFGAPTEGSTNAKHCPGYVKPPKGGPTPSEPSATKFSGSVTADNAGFKVPGKYKGAVCISQSGTISLLKALKVS